MKLVDATLPDEAELVRLWYSDESMTEISRQLGITPDLLSRVWNKMKYEGRLPTSRRRKKNFDAYHAEDTRPANDLLLAKLIEAHPEGPRYDIQQRKK